MEVEGAVAVEGYTCDPGVVSGSIEEVIGLPQGGMISCSVWKVPSHLSVWVRVGMGGESI